MAFMRAPVRRIITIWARAVGPKAPPPNERGVGLYHLAWEVDEIEALREARDALERYGTFSGASDHGATKSIYGYDPDGNEFEVMWMVPREHWAEYENAHRRARSTSMGKSRAGARALRARSDVERRTFAHSPLLVIIATAMYLGLSIAGEGGFAAFFSQPALVALAVVFLAVAIAAIFAGGGLSTHEREDRSNRWVLIPFAIVGLALGFVPAYSDRIGFLTIDGNAIRWLGVLLSLPGAFCEFGRSSYSAIASVDWRTLADASTGDDRHLRLHPSSQLCRTAHWLRRMEPCLPFGCGIDSYGVACPCGLESHPLRGGSACAIFWTRIRRLSGTHVTFASGNF